MTPEPVYVYWATLRKLVDADTLHVTIHLGLDVSVNTTIRLFGVNAPETRGETREAGFAAADFAWEWFTWRAPDGRFVVETLKDKRGKFGRYLGIVHGVGDVNREALVAGVHVDPVLSLNDALLTAGHAVPYTV